MGYKKTDAAGDRGLSCCFILTLKSTLLFGRSQVPAFIQEVPRWCSTSELIDDSVFVGEDRLAVPVHWLGWSRGNGEAVCLSHWGHCEDEIWHGGEAETRVFCMCSEVLLYHFEVLFMIRKCKKWPAEYFFFKIVNAINSDICGWWILIGILELRGPSKCVDCCSDSGNNVSDVLVMQREKCMGGGGLKTFSKILYAFYFVLHCRHWKSVFFWWGMYVIFVSQL